MSMAGTPVRPCNRVFHHHLANHVTVPEAFEADRRTPPARSLVRARNTAGGTPAAAGAYDAHATHGTGGVPDRLGPDGARHHMQGLVVGITVSARGPAPMAREPKRAVRLVARSRASVHGQLPGYAYLLGGTPAEAAPD